jgi:serine/threonine-protein kinase
VAAVSSPLADALRDRYVIDRELGHGGMATVWLARDLKHDRLVALKVLRAELSAILGGERFLREIRLTAALQHPHILPLLDSGEAAGVLYYVMPYVEGESLRHRVEREGQLPLEDALQLTRGVAAALEYAHRQGVIHRDIKPENILLYQGEPMVADFGIALAAASAGRERLTETGLSLGTPAYMSPEQASAAGKLDSRSDQYSLACVVYEMLAGEPPYTGPTAQAIIAKRFSEPVPHLSTVRTVPAAVEAAVTRALAKAPADRFPSVADFAAALHRAPASRFVSRRMAALVGGVVVLGTLALVAFFARPRDVALPMATRQFTFTGKVTEPALSPDGKAVAYISGHRSLVVQRLDGSEPLVLIPPTRYAGTPRWTLDGRTIVLPLMRDSTELAATWAVPSGGGPARKVLEDMVPPDPGPDSTTIVRFPHGKHHLEIVDWRTGKVTKVIELPDSLVASLEQVMWSPGQRLFAFERSGVIWAVPADGGAPSRIASGFNPRWSRDGHAVYFLGGPPGSEALFRAAIDPRSGSLEGMPTQLLSLPRGVAFDVRGNRLVYTLTSTSRQARALVIGGKPSQITGDRQLTSGSAPITGVTITADGQTVAYSEVRGQEADIYAIPFDGGPPRRLAGSPATESSPMWSPEGSRLAYVRQDSSGVALMVMDVGAGTSQRVGTVPIAPGVWAHWSADGRRLSYFTADQHGVAMVDVRGQTESVIRIPDSVGTAYGQVVPSPDGQAIVGSTLHRWSDWGEDWTGSVGGTGWRRVRGPFGESNIVEWHADGWLYLLNHRVLSTDYGPLRLELWRVKGTEGIPELVVQLPEGCEQTDVSADATHVVCVTRRTESDIYVATDFDPNLR